MRPEENDPIAAVGRDGEPGVTRRQVLAGAVQFGAAAVAGGGLLAACGSSSSSSRAPSGVAASTLALLPGSVAELPGGTPVRGGTFTVACFSGGASENLWPGTVGFVPDVIREYALYDFLLTAGRDEVPMTPGLALSWEPNSDATIWTFHLRPGVRWHDGTPFTAADVIYNFKLWSNGAADYGAAYLTGIVDTKNVRARDKLTVEVPLLRPVAQFPSILTYFNFGLVKNGATAKEAARNPIGTGPFKFESFTAGQQSVFTANKEYWEEGKPYVDKLVVQSSYTDQTALVNAMLSGAANLLPAPPPIVAKQQLAAKSMQILVGPVSSQNFTFNMRVDKGPFVDNRIREGFKLLVNRQEMVNAGWGGAGTVCADLIGPPNDPYYLSSAKPTHDVERARALFKAAGVAGETFSWPVADYVPGIVESVTLLAQEAPAAGINVAVRNVPIATYFAAAGGAYTRYAGTNFWQPAPSLLVMYLAALTQNAPARDTWWGHQAGGNGVPSGADAQKLIEQATAEVDPSKAADLWHECQQQQRDYGGYVIWGNQPYIDAAANNVRGLKAGANFNYDNFRFQDGWLA
jgi:peptide/nickel transport system substrate-binding protein